MLQIQPVELKQANAFVESLHRHHKKVTGHRLKIGAFVESELVGVAICGRPVARALNPLEYLEVTRVCTDGTKNACSKLYGASARVGRELGYKWVQTYILESELGTSLKASGWEMTHEVVGRSWDAPSRRRTDKHPTENKTCWRKKLND